MALTSLATIKGFLGIPSSVTTTDAQLGALQAAAEDSVKSYCNRDFESTSYVEFATGNNTRWLYLKQRPVTALTSVYEDYPAAYGHNPSGSFSSSTLLTDGVDYVMDWDSVNGTQSKSGLLIRLRTVWSLPARIYTPGRLFPDNGPAFGNVKVVYTAGFTTVPSDVQYAVCFLVSLMRRTVGTGALVHGERIGDYSYELGTARFPQPPEIGSLRSLLARYREIAC